VRRALACGGPRGRGAGGRRRCVRAALRAVPSAGRGCGSFARARSSLTRARLVRAALSARRSP
jgi:hypothetical protein